MCGDGKRGRLRLWESLGGRRERTLERVGKAGEESWWRVVALRARFKADVEVVIYGRWYSGRGTVEGGRGC